MIRVFVADGSRAVRGQIREALREVQGVRIAGGAGTVAAAVAGVKRLKPQAILLDPRIPGGKGLEALKRIRDREQGFRPLIIVLTSYAHGLYRKKCLADGAQFVFDKATELEKAIEVLRRHAQPRRLPHAWTPIVASSIRSRRYPPPQKKKAPRGALAANRRTVADTLVAAAMPRGDLSRNIAVEAAAPGASSGAGMHPRALRREGGRRWQRD